MVIIYWTITLDGIISISLSLIIAIIVYLLERKNSRKEQKENKKLFYLEKIDESNTFLKYCTEYYTFSAYWKGKQYVNYKNNYMNAYKYNEKSNQYIPRSYLKVLLFKKRIKFREFLAMIDNRYNDPLKINNKNKKSN